MKINYKNQDVNVPDFLIVGGAKCGTTSISRYLSQHSKVFIPKLKECRFLSGMQPNFKGPGDNVVNNEMITNISDYTSLFNAAKPNQLLCDASVDYLYYYKKTTENIKKYYGKNSPKIVIILRNPVKSSFSMYSHLKRDLREKESLEKAIRDQKARLKDNWEWVWQYTDMAKYAESVEYFLNSFDQKKIKIIIFEEFINNIEAEFKDLLDFLELEGEKINLNRTYNQSGSPKSKILQKLILKKGKIIMALKNIVPSFIKEGIVNANISKVSITDQDIALLAPYFEKDINQLEKVLNRDLKVWKSQNIVSKNSIDG